MYFYAICGFHPYIVSCENDQTIIQLSDGDRFLGTIFVPDASLANIIKKFLHEDYACVCLGKLVGTTFNFISDYHETEETLKHTNVIIGYSDSDREIITYGPDEFEDFLSDITTHYPTQSVPEPTPQPEGTITISQEARENIRQSFAAAANSSQTWRSI